MYGPGLVGRWECFFREPEFCAVCVIWVRDDVMSPVLCFVFSVVMGAVCRSISSPLSSMMQEMPTTECLPILLCKSCKQVHNNKGTIRAVVQVAKVRPLKDRDAAQLLMDKVPTSFTKKELRLSPSHRCTREDILKALEAHPVLKAAEGHPGTLVSFFFLSRGLGGVCLCCWYRPR